MINENSLFTDKELIIDSNITKTQYLNFIHNNFDKISFSKLADAFLITPLEQRESHAEFRELTELMKIKLNKQRSDLMSKIVSNSIELNTQLKNQDPRCLLTLASEIFKLRYRFNEYHFNKDEYTDLIKIITQIEIGVTNNNKEICWNINNEYNNEASYNLLIYFANHYNDYNWDSEKAYFKNSAIQIAQTSNELILFQLLNNESDSIALNAFIQLTNCDSQKVKQIAREYDNINLDKNYSIPIFTNRFLNQLIQLVAVYKQYHINYYTNTKVINYINRLKMNLSFKDRRNLEDEIINELDLNDISSFEYWALINESNWKCTYSSGRILDVFYSNHFDELVHNSQQLQLYLIKAALFDELGIIGICNNYLIKFTGLQREAIIKLNTLETTDAVIKKQIELAKIQCQKSINFKTDKTKSNSANFDTTITNIKWQFANCKNISNQEKRESYLCHLLSQVNYNQIGIAIEQSEKIKFKDNSWEKYCFLERDFGFFSYNDFDSISTRNEFLADYNRFSEYDFYKNILDKSGTNYFNKNEELDYDQIYVALKYNVVSAFVGGGGGNLDNEVYALIKILEIKHQTTLGYPIKLCNSSCIYGCSSLNRTYDWMHYLKENQLVKKIHDIPVSFHFNME